MPSAFAVDIQYWISTRQLKNVAVMANRQKSKSKRTTDNCTYLNSRNSVTIALHAQPRVTEYLSTKHINSIAFCMRIVFNDTGSQLGSGGLPSRGEPPLMTSPVHLKTTADQLLKIVLECHAELNDNV